MAIRHQASSSFQHTHTMVILNAWPMNVVSNSLTHNCLQSVNPRSHVLPFSAVNYTHGKWLPGWYPANEITHNLGGICQRYPHQIKLSFTTWSTQHIPPLAGGAMVFHLHFSWFSLHMLFVISTFHHLFNHIIYPPVLPRVRPRSTIVIFSQLSSESGYLGIQKP